jgi:hypothetical protein
MSRIQVKIYDGTGRRVHTNEAVILFAPVEELKDIADQFISDLVKSSAHYRIEDTDAD